MHRESKQRADIRREYRMLRLNADRSQREVEALAGLDSGRYWKIENGYVIPTDDEAKAIAKVLKVTRDRLPMPEIEARAS